jgi:hypothetical protein
MVRSKASKLSINLRLTLLALLAAERRPPLWCAALLVLARNVLALLALLVQEYTY